MANDQVAQLEKKSVLQAAVDESDLNRLELKIQQAEVAIFQRIEAFSSAHDGEEEALFEALRKIRELANQLTPIQSRRLRSGDAFQNRRNQLVGEVRLVQHLNRSDAIRQFLGDIVSAQGNS